MPDIDLVIKDTSGLNAAQLADATNSTFADYFRTIRRTAAGFAAFCRWNSVDMANSVLLEDGKGRLVGLAMLARRGARGWCGGFGIVPERRGLGLSKILLAALLASARAFGLSTMLLEVMVQNERAIKTYHNAGFERRRDFVTLTGKMHDAGPADPTVSVKPIKSSDAALNADFIPAPVPCWQREDASLRQMDDLRVLTALRADQRVGVLLYRPNRPSGPLILSCLAYKDERAAVALLDYAMIETRLRSVFLLNEPVDSPLIGLLRSFGLKEIDRQHEMVLTL